MLPVNSMRIPWTKYSSASVAAARPITIASPNNTRRIELNLSFLLAPAGRGCANSCRFRWRVSSGSAKKKRRHDCRRCRPGGPRPLEHDGQFTRRGLHCRGFLVARHRSFRDLDGWLLLLSLVICALGVLQIYSATHDTKWHNAWWKQLLWIVIGLGLMYLISSVVYHTLLGQVPLIYFISIAALLLTFAVGDMVFHSRRWIPLPIPGMTIEIQVSEFEKIVIILLVARYLSELKGDTVGIRDLLKLGG